MVKRIKIDPTVQVLKNGTTQNRRMVKCLCDCGRITIKKLVALTTGGTTSCGCLMRKEKPYHRIGLHKHPLHHIWTNMKQRCYNERHIAYHRYGGRGISICEEWLNDFKKFYDWAIENNWHSELQIDRIDNDLGYSPENCRMATPRLNSNNRSDTIFVDLRGERMPFRFACDKLGLKAKIVWQTMNRKNLTFNQALSFYGK